MKTRIHGNTLKLLLLVTTLSVASIGHTDDTSAFTTTPVSPSSEGSDSIRALAKYVFNLGGDLGFDLNMEVDTPISTLLITPPTVLQSMAAAALITMIGSIPVDTSSSDSSSMNFVPSNNATYAAFNALANTTFMSYQSPSSGGASSGSATSAAVTVSPLMDQQAYQADPVSQFVLNLMSTPNYTYCMDSAGNWLNNNSQTIGDCDYLYSNKILNNVVGTIPATPFLASNTQNPIISELNSNSLIAPLLYSTTSSSTTTSNSNASGLIATNQAEQANNFIRYASGAAMPIPMPTQTNYNNLLFAINSPASSRLTKEKALALLDTYFAGMRSYAAQVSVPVSNLYYILSKRIPQAQSQKESNANATSQALTEMTMATRRLYNPAGVATDTPQWITQINTASPATVQKEMAILLAEINYQLYLNRQQDERLLLTNSLLLIEALKQNMPSAPSSEEIASATTGTSGTTGTTGTSGASATSDIE